MPKQPKSKAPQSNRRQSKRPAADREESGAIVEGAPTGDLRSSLRATYTTPSPRPDSAGLGIDSAGQSGGTDGLSRAEYSSESVEDLAEEGQAYEAAFVSGAEQASEDGDAGVPRLRRKEEAI